MNFRSLFMLVAFLFASSTVNGQQTITITVTQELSPTSVVPSSTASTLATIALGTPLSPSAIATQAAIVYDTTASASSDGDSDGGQVVDTNAGASGSSAVNSFNLSKGGLIAIIIVVVIVVIFGIASTVLFVLAKRRQWNVRASIGRASRRLTGRFGGDKRDSLAERKDRRTAIYAGGPRKVSPPRVVAIKPPGHDRGLVVNVQDVEKGPLYDTRSADSGSSKSTWTSKFFAQK
nr:hypothetical protein CFP56_71748 [Quercus suber]